MEQATSHTKQMIELRSQLWDQAAADRGMAAPLRVAYQVYQELLEMGDAQGILEQQGVLSHAMARTLTEGNVEDRTEVLNIFFALFPPQGTGNLLR